MKGKRKRSRNQIALGRDAAKRNRVRRILTRRANVARAALHETIYDLDTDLSTCPLERNTRSLVQHRPPLSRKKKIRRKDQTYRETFPNRLRFLSLFGTRMRCYCRNSSTRCRIVLVNQVMCSKCFTLFKELRLAVWVEQPRRASKVKSFRYFPGAKPMRVVGFRPCPASNLNNDRNPFLRVVRRTPVEVFSSLRSLGLCAVCQERIPVSDPLFQQERLCRSCLQQYQSKDVTVFQGCRSTYFSLVPVAGWREATLSGFRVHPSPANTLNFNNAVFGGYVVSPINRPQVQVGAACVGQVATQGTSNLTHEQDVSAMDSSREVMRYAEPRIHESPAISAGTHSEYHLGTFEHQQPPLSDGPRTTSLRFQ